MAKKSRDKGKRGELEVAALLKEWGVEARRGQQFHGGPDSPDVVHSLDGIHIEVKRVEAFALYTSLAQADEDSGDDIPVVFHRRNDQPWTVVLHAEDFLYLLGLRRPTTLDED